MSRIARAGAGAALLFALAANGSTEAHAQPTRQRIRPTSGAIDEALKRGYQRSAIFRRLVDTLEQSAVLVYVGAGRCPAIGRQRLNGCLAHMGTSDGIQHLRVVVDAARPMDQLIATIGHELQHAIEAAGSPSAEPGGRHGVAARPVGGNVYETDAAQDVKAAILRDLRLDGADCGTATGPATGSLHRCTEPTGLAVIPRYRPPSHTSNGVSPLASSDDVSYTGRPETMAQRVTELLLAWGEGDQGALAQLIPLVHAELRRVARHYMAGERQGHTLQPTALVNEVYLRLVDLERIRWQNRAHFMAVAARLMRRVLVDFARSRNYQKRGGDAQRVVLDESLLVDVGRGHDLEALDEALNRLAGVDSRKSQIVVMRFFGGLSVDEVAEVLEISAATVTRDWKLAKTWLLRELDRTQTDQCR